MDLEGVDLLSEEECRRLLRQAQVGRVAVSLGAVAAVFPVNYTFAGEEILFFTAEGTKLRAATSEMTVTFEVDHIDPFAETGWSVLVVGKARERTEPALVAGVQRSGLRPWAAGDRFHLIAITPDFVSGRRVGQAIALNDSSRRHGRHALGPHAPVGGLAQPPVRVEADSTLQSVADAMGRARVSAVLFGQDQAIVTERDLTRAYKAGLEPQDQAAAICVTDLICVDDDTTVVEAAIEMLRQEIRHLVLRNWRGELTGIVTLGDVLGVLVDAMDPAVWVLIQHSLSVKTRPNPLTSGASQA